MKQLTYILFILSVTFLTACSANESADKSSESEKATEQKQEETEESGVSVDKGLLNVEVTVPASFIEGEDIDTVIAEAEEDGAKEVTKNEDGSITYKMSKSDHKKMMTEMGTSITDAIEEMKSSGDYVSIKDITHNKSFTEFTLLVDKASFENSFDGFAILGLGFQGSMYQLFNGENPDNYKVTITVKDESTQEVIDEVIYPDAFEAMAEAEEATTE
ncbi:hypothetical protein D1B33_09815 [Lysinibacillus yapensis]|uniref:Antigen I/II N-terminal domain-containing protein n=1 Tax=Ureibacillus yapensis TaxID=2304605 RepID=A0A396S859_9BACL|nr:hypothetical protein [Lysinibacillus yapensis]RHW36687.1 hypothetical protein D1B33_09815 [Lysinibacillus yapensis]